MSKISVKTNEWRPRFKLYSRTQTRLNILVSKDDRVSFQSNSSNKDSHVTLTNRSTFQHCSSAFLSIASKHKKNDHHTSWHSSHAVHSPATRGFIHDLAFQLTLIINFTHFSSHDAWARPTGVKKTHKTTVKGSWMLIAVHEAKCVCFTGQWNPNMTKLCNDIISVIIGLFIHTLFGIDLKAP